MPLALFLARLVGLSATLHKWRLDLAALDISRRREIARYAEVIAETLGRAAKALVHLETNPTDTNVRRDAIRELGRVAGYIEDIVACLRNDLDGRKLAGVKRRLDGLAETQPIRVAVIRHDPGRIDDLTEAEGYFRALADALKL